MVHSDDDTDDSQGTREPPDATRYAGVPPGGYEPHPLFPRDDDGPEMRDIQFISFRRRRSDGKIDNLPEDIPAGEIDSWAYAVGPWGGGEYKAIGKDKNHRIIAWYPEKNGEWMLFDMESKPFTLRGQTYRHSPPVAAPAANPAPAAAAAPSPLPAPPQPSTPHHLEATVAELLRELRAARAPSNDTAMVEMIKAQGELMRTVLSSVLAPRPVEASPRPTAEPMTMALQLLTAMREWQPKPQPQPSVTDRLGEYRAIRELTTPAAPPPPQSEFGEIKDLLMSVAQADALSKNTREAAPVPVPERRLPPPRAPLRHVPGLGMVEVVQPEGPPHRAADRNVDIAALLSDPILLERVRKALGIETPAKPAPAAISAPLPVAPEATASTAHAVAVEPAPEVSLADAAAARTEGRDTPSEATPDPETSPIVALPTASMPPISPPTAPIAADERRVIELPAAMPIPEPLVATEAERQRAQWSLANLAKLPRDQLRVALSKIPGVDSNVDDLISAIGDLPPVAWPFIVTKLPVDAVRALAGPGG